MLKKFMCMAIITVLVMLFSTVGLAATDDLKELYQAARAEGKLTWQYFGGEAIKEVTDAFQAKYPDVKITVFNMAATAIATRIITEAAARKLSMDVISSYPNYNIPLLERKLLMKYDWTKLGVAKDHILLEGTNIWFGDTSYIWFYNKNLVSKADVPKTYEDLLDPKFKGDKISVRAAPSAFASLYPAWKNDKQKITGYFERLRQQQVVPGKRATEVASRVANGESFLGSAPIEIVAAMIKDNAPIAVAPITPVAGSPTVLAIPQDAPHPNAAKLLIAWLNSTDGKAALRKAGLGQASPCDVSVGAKLLCDNGITNIPITSSKDLIEFDTVFAKMVVEKMGFMPE
jgi:iron(III) transport system substrate-binding protein